MKKNYQLLLLFLLFHVTTITVSQVNLKDGLVACYPFNGNANDETGSGNNGIVLRAALTNDRFGKPNSAYNFQDFAFIRLPSNKFAFENYSYSLWFNATNFPQNIDPSGGQYNILSIGDRCRDQNILIENDNFGVSGISGGEYKLTKEGLGRLTSTGILPTIGKWYHAVVTRDKNDIKLYVDGVLTKTVSTGGELPNYSCGGEVFAHIGTKSSLEFFYTGNVDDIHIYKRALNADEVKALYNGNPSQAVTISASNLTPCGGDKITFTANGATGTSKYQWKVDGVNQGTNSKTFDYTFVKKTVDYTVKVSVEVTDEDVCFPRKPIIIDKDVTFKNDAKPTIALAIDKPNPCGGESIAITSNGGTVDSKYVWKIDGITQTGNTKTVNYTTVKKTADYTVKVTVEVSNYNPCNPTDFVTSEQIVTIKNYQIPTVTLTTSYLTPCGGDKITVTANGATGTSKYQWKVDGVNQGTNSKTFDYTSEKKTADYTAKISVEVSNYDPCNPTNLVTVEQNIPFKNYQAPVITISATNLTPCGGDKITVTANGATSTSRYQWKVDGVNQGTNSKVFEYSIEKKTADYFPKITVEVTEEAFCFPRKQTSTDLNIIVRECTPIPSTSTAVNLKDGLVACYPFNGNPKDETGNGNNGIANGATLTTDRFGKPNSAYNFNGASTITVSPDQFKNQSYTYAMWVKIDDLPALNTGVGLIGLGKFAGEQFVGFTNTANYANGFGGGGFNVPANPFFSNNYTNINPDKDKWYHVVITRDDVAMRLYVNGVLNVNNGLYSATNGTKPNYPSDSRFVFGARNDNSPTTPFSSFLKGSLDDIHIYNRAINTTEVKALYDGNPGQAITISANNLTPCGGDKITFTANNATSTSKYQWKVDGVNQGTSSKIFDYTSVKKTADQTVKITVEVTDEEVCFPQKPTIVDKELTFKNYPKPIISFDIDKPNLCSSDSILITANGGTNTSKYQWKVNGTNQGTDSKTFKYTSAKQKDDFTVKISVEVSNFNLCAPNDQITESQNVVFKDCTKPIIVPNATRNVFIPNAFSPNGDGVNDTWDIGAVATNSTTIVEIYNRWGTLIFYSKGYTEPWNGTYKDNLVMAGTYVYVIRMNNETVYRGKVLVIR